MTEFDKNLKKIRDDAVKRGEAKIKGVVRTGSDADTAKSASEDLDAANNIDDTLTRRRNR